MKPITALDILDQLNMFIQDDREAVENLVALRVDCTKLQFTCKTLVPHKSEYERSLAGLLEVLNCLLHPSAAIVPVFDTCGTLLKFRLSPVEGT